MQSFCSFSDTECRPENSSKQLYWSKVTVFEHFKSFDTLLILHIAKSHLIKHLGNAISNEFCIIRGEPIVHILWMEEHWEKGVFVRFHSCYISFSILWCINSDALKSLVQWINPEEVFFIDGPIMVVQCTFFLNYSLFQLWRKKTESSRVRFLIDKSYWKFTENW